MRKHLLALFLVTALATVANAQSRGVRIGYIDMEYILEKVPDYAEAKNQLEIKAQKWKQDAEVKRNEITKLKENLKTERVLLTKELIEEREEEISFLETELLDFQQKRFGSTGDLITQKAILVKPIQDQVFTIVQDIATAKKYDFVFDKSSDLTMLFGAERFNISDQVVRQLTRSTKREQLSKKELKDEEAEERRQDMIDENPDLAEREKVLEDRKLAREKLLEDRKLAAEDKKRAFAEKRARLLEEREAKKNEVKATREKGTTEEKNSDSETSSPETTAKGETEGEKTAAETAAAEKRAAADAAKKVAAEERQRKLDERKQALEEKRKKILADREAAKKEREEKTSTPENTTE